MNVLHLLFTKGWGGLERYAIEQARAMAARGHKTVFLLRRGARTSEELRDEKVMRVLEMRPIKYIDIRAIITIRSLVKREGINIVHAHNSADLGLAAAALWNMPEVRLIFSNYMWAPRPKRDIYHRLEYGRVERVLTGSEELRKNSIENLPVRPGQVETLPYGLDMSRFDPGMVEKGALRERFSIPPQAPLIGVISRLDPLKGQMEMIEAMPAILKRKPDAVLALTGGETPELSGTFEPKLRARADELGVSSSVIFTGPTDDTASILADLDIYVLPSYAETFSLGCLEAMAMEKPVIGTRAGGTPEMLDNGECGLLAQPRDARSLSKNVIKLLDNPSLAKSMGEAAREKVLMRYDKKVVMDRLDAIYKGTT